MNQQYEQSELDREREKLLNQNQQPQRPEASANQQQDSPANRLQQLVQAAESSQKRHRIQLVDLSKAYGANVEVEVVDLSASDLMASGIVPGNARKVVSDFIRRSEDITKLQRDQVGMMELAEEIAQERYDGDTMEVMGGLVALMRAVAVLGTKQFLFNGAPNDPPISLAMERDDAKNSLYIGLLTDRDVNMIAGQIWSNTEMDAAQAEPFPDTGHTPETVSPGGDVWVPSERADQV